MHKRKRFPRLRRLIPTTRRGRIVGGLLGFFVMAGVGAAVAAVFFATAQINGTGTTGTFGADFVSTSAPTNTGIQCASVVNLAALKLTLTNAYASGSCTVPATVETVNASESGRVSGIAIPGLPTGWTAALTGASCGQTITTSGTANVTFAITAPATVTPGSFTIGAGAGVQISPVSVVGVGTLTCPTYTAP